MTGVAFRLLRLFAVMCSALAAGALLVGRGLPDGVIAYTKSTVNGRSDLYLLDVATRFSFNLTRTPALFEDHAFWSADGEQIAFQRAGEGRSQICVFSQVNTCYDPLSVWDYAPLLSPDGRWLAFLSTDHLLHLRDTLDGSLRALGDSDQLIFDPQWSPDGAQMLYVRSDAASPRRVLYVAARDLSAVRPIDTGALQVSAPVWSPDGRQIAFVGQDAQTFKNIYVIDLDGGQPRPLSSGQRDAEPAWSPDGRRIVFVSARSQSYALYLVNADGSGERPLTHDDQPDILPVWSPDSTRVVFVSERADGYHLYVVKVESGETLPLTTDRGAQSYPAWRP